MNATTTITVLFADVAGSTALYETLGDDAALARIGECLAMAEVISTRARGRMVKRIGDGFMCAFRTPDDAVGAAAEMQLAQAERRDGLSLRLGFHAGEAIEREHDLFGYAVNVAARIAQLAQPGQILTTAPTVQALPDYMRRGVRDLGVLALRGKMEPIQTFEVIWRWSSEQTNVGDGPPAPRMEGTLLLEHEQLAYRLVDDGTHLTLGRGAVCDVVVEHPFTSRLHARIEAIDGRYVLHDLSANGTYVCFDDDREFLLRRAEAPLRRRGRIGLGASTQAGGPVLRFSCD